MPGSTGTLIAEETEQRHRRLIAQVHAVIHLTIPDLVTDLLDPWLTEHNPIDWQESNLRVAGVPAIRLEGTSTHDPDPSQHVVAVFVFPDPQHCYMLCLIAPLLGKDDFDSQLRGEDTDLMDQVLAGVTFAAAPAARNR
jgi:hypothetical protein